MKNQENTEIESAADALKNEYSQENLGKLVQLLQDSTLYVPALFPPDIDPAVIRGMLESGGKQQELPRGVSPRPGILQDSEGKRYLPVFTTREQLMRGKRHYPLILSAPFQECIHLLMGEKGVSGIVLNAFGQNVILNTDITREKEQADRKVGMTEPQLHAAIRQRVEANLLPKAFFEQKDALIKDFQARGGEVIMDLYQKLYPEQVACPYAETDFDIMALNISETLLILRIIMPAKKLASGLCPVVFASWNPVEDRFRYFGVVLGDQGEPPHILEASESGEKYDDLGQAPREGSELQYLIDLCQG